MRHIIKNIKSIIIQKATVYNINHTINVAKYNDYNIKISSSLVLSTIIKNISCLDDEGQAALLDKYKNNIKKLKTAILNEKNAILNIAFENKDFMLKYKEQDCINYFSLQKKLFNTEFFEKILIVTFLVMLREFKKNELQDTNVLDIIQRKQFQVFRDHNLLSVVDKINCENTDEIFNEDYVNYLFHFYLKKEMTNIRTYLEREKINELVKGESTIKINQFKL